MKAKNALKALSAAVVMATASLSASAGYVIIDGWQMNVPNFTPALTTNIGHLTLGGGESTVQQETSGGVAFVGARFTESGNIFSLNYVKENRIGSGDAGFPQSFGLDSGLELVFSNVTGYVDGLNAGGGFSYLFDGGLFDLRSSIDGGTTFTTYASGSIVGIGGNTSSTNVIGGTAGDSNVLASVLAMIGLFDFRDSLGTSLAPDMAAGNVLVQVTTTNTLDGNSPVGGGCNFGSGAVECVTIRVTSEGAANLVRAVPEPASIALLGLGLLGLGAVRRRKSAK